jgi:peptidoglycan/LPS O-acetylase OafA/YrhL
MMFFLLSGFVIYANERGRVDVDLVGYTIRRLVRIYPPLIFAMCVSAAVAAIDGVFWERLSLSSMIGTIFALQDTVSAAPGTPVSPFMANSPLWSLAYEIWFYALFPFAHKLYGVHKARGSVAIGLICAASYLAYIVVPSHFLLMTGYFAIWWLGSVDGLPQV